MSNAATVDIQSYPEFVNLLFKTGEAISADIMERDPAVLSRLHACVGLVGECIELLTATSWQNTLEELGDIAFYFRALEETTLCYAIADEPQFHPCVSPTYLIIAAGTLLDLSKKESMYNKALDSDQWEKFFKAMNNFKFAFESLVIRHHLTMNQVQDANVEKLSKPYPGLTYSNVAAKIESREE